MKFYYGLSNLEELKNKIKSICDILGGGNPAKDLLLETTIAETLGGTYKVLVRYNYGLGLTQFDKIAFDDIQKRTSSARKKLILNELNIDLEKIEYRELAYSPLLSILFCRLFYLLKPGKIPSSLEERAKYWKKYYNTKLGKGTVEGYIKKVEEFKRRVM